jgi:hypothetical protein
MSRERERERREREYSTALEKEPFEKDHREHWWDSHRAGNNACFYQPDWKNM